MPDAQIFDFGFSTRPALRLNRIEQLIKEHRIIVPVPQRATLIEMVRRGDFEGHLTNVGWVVFEDSFKRWAKSMSGLAETEPAES